MQRESTWARPCGGLRHDPGAGRDGRGRRRSARPGRDAGRRWPASWARPGTCTCEKVLRVDRDENLRMIAESVAFLQAQGKRGRLRRRAFLRRLRRPPRLRPGLPARGGRGGGRDGVPLRHQRGHPAHRRCGEIVRRGGGRAGRRAAWASTPTTTRAAPWPTALVAVEAGADAGAGHHQRLRRALRQRRPVLHHPRPEAEDGPATASPTRPGPAHRRRPTSWPSSATSRPIPTSPTWAATPSPTRAGMHVAAVTRDPAHLRAHRRRSWWGTSRTSWSRSSPARATIRQRAQELGYSRGARTELAERVLRAGQGAEHDGYHYEAADASFELLLRGELGMHAELLPPGELPHHRGEAGGRRRW